MARSLAPIPADAPITNKTGSVTDFFRLRWQQLLDGFAQSPTVGNIRRTAQTALIASTVVYTTRAEGLYRVSFVMKKTIADGVSSSLTMTLAWVRGAVGCSEVGTALATDTTAAQQNGSIFVRADALTDLTFSIAYASNTPAKMTYEVDVVAELLVTA